MDDDQGDVAQAAIQHAWAGCFGIVPLSPHVARVAALEAEVARLLAANAILQRCAETIAAADVPAIPAFPVRALTFGAQRIGLLVGPY